jgi:hypothetical protein
MKGHKIGIHFDGTMYTSIHETHTYLQISG